MINFRKAGLLIITLVIPALIFLFLKLFATNHYDLPYYHPQADREGRVVVQHGDTLFYKVPDITLKSTNGQPFTWVSGRGNLTVAGYLPGNCDDSCKLALNQWERVFALREHIPNLYFVTITDHWSGKKDFYPASMDTDGWKVLTGAGEDVDKVSHAVLKLQTNVPGSKTNSQKNRLVLIDTEGHIRGYYHAADVEETDRLMAEVKILDYERKSN